MSSTRDRVEELARDLDMVVYRLEQLGVDAAPAELRAERLRVRRDLERVRDQMEDLARAL